MQASFGIRELAERARREGAVDLAQGIIDASPPRALLRAFHELPIEHCSTYNNKRGVPEYREAVRAYLSARGWPVPQEQIIGSAGAMGATVAALLTECRPGATVLLPEPFFIGHKLMLEALGFAVRYIPVPLDAPPDWETLAGMLPEADALLLTSPANPTGQVVSADILRELSATAAAHDCLLILDEVYRDFNWQEDTPNDSSYRELDLSQTVVVRSFSKTFAIPGWRAGFAVTAPERIEKLALQHDALYIGGSTPAQNALAAVLENNRDELASYVTDLRKTLMNNRTVLAKSFQDFGMTPLAVPASYYMLMQHNRESDMAAMEELMAKKVAVTPLNIVFSNSDAETGYIRIHFAVSAAAAQKVAAALRN
jgi:aspartate/methionine/tyrosine aminotransferase